jgi:ferredoxin, 2Fe-2S
MPRILVVPFNKKIIPLAGESIFTALRRHGFPIASSCGGDGVCAKCVITIIKGADNCSSTTLREKELISDNVLGTDERLSCQVYATGDVELSTSYW